MRHRGTRRTKRYFSELEATALLRALGAARKACRQAMAIAPINEPPYKAAGAVMDAIDAAGEALTGKPKPWLPRAHGGPDEGKPYPAPGEASPALEAAIYDVLRAELYVSYAGAEAQDEHLADLAGRLAAAALSVQHS